MSFIWDFYCENIYCICKQSNKIWNPHVCHSFPSASWEKHDFIQPLICKVANELMNQSDQTPLTIYTVTLMDMFALKSYF